jgi:outer membrane protein assembly factor BamB
LLWRDKLYLPVLRRDRVVEKGKPAAEVSPGELLDSFILAIDAPSGKDVWKQVRKGDGKEGALEAYSTPVPFETPERREVVLSGSDSITGHNPDSGTETWHWGAMLDPESSRTVVTALVGYKEGLIYGAGSQRQPFYAIKAGASGPVADAQVAWKYTESPANVCTPAYSSGALYLLDHNRKTFTRLDAKSGEKKWQCSLTTGGAVNIRASFSASPTVADGRVYCVSEAGDVLIFSAGDEFKLLSHVPLEESGCYSSIAVAHGHLFLRTGQNLYCIGK